MFKGFILKGFFKDSRVISNFQLTQDVHSILNILNIPVQDLSASKPEYKDTTLN